MRSRISKWGNSLGVRIPRSFAEEAGLRDGTLVEVTVEDGRVVIEQSLQSGSVAGPGHAREPTRRG